MPEHESYPPQPFSPGPPHELDEFAVLRELGTGDFTRSCDILRDRAASEAITRLMQQLDGERKAPDITAYGMGMIRLVATKLALAGEYQRVFWHTMLYRMLDPAYTAQEIRHEDLNILDSLNPADALLLYAGGRTGLLFQRCCHQWQQSGTYKRLREIGRGEEGTEALFKLLQEGLPFTFLMDAIALELDTQLRLDERAFIQALKSRRQDSEHPLFTTAYFCEDYCSQLSAQLMSNTKRGTATARIGTDITRVISELREFGRLALVDYGLNDVSSRVYRLLND